MPIYEFYCPDCHTIFSFLSPTTSRSAAPACPKCQRPGLERRPSTFALSTGAARDGGEGEDDGLAGLDEGRLEGAMESVLGDFAEGAEDDPRQMAHLLKRFGDAAGLEPGPRMEEMIRRLESGEDPEALEEGVGGDMGDSEAFEEFFRQKRQRASKSRPKVDKELYFL